VAAHQNRRKTLLPDGYVCSVLGSTVSITPPALIEAKRIQLKLKRLLKDLSK
jgi:hypothetical protein